MMMADEMIHTGQRRSEWRWMTDTTLSLCARTASMTSTTGTAADTRIIPWTEEKVREGYQTEMGRWVASTWWLRFTHVPKQKQHSVTCSEMEQLLGLRRACVPSRPECWELRCLFWL